MASASIPTSARCFACSAWVMNPSGIPSRCTREAVREQAAPLERLQASGAEAARQAPSSTVTTRRARAASRADELLVERLHEARVDHRRGDPLPRELLGRGERRPQRGPDRDQHTSGLPGTARATRPLPIARGAGGGSSSTPSPAPRGKRKADGPVVVQRGVEHVPQLVLVRRRHHHEVRHAAEVGEVERALVRRAVGADEAAAVEREGDRQALERDVVDDLVVGALQEGRVDRRPPAGSPRRRGRRRRSPRAARRCRRRRCGRGSAASP